MSFVIYSCKTGKCWNQNIFTNIQNFVKFDSNPLVCNPILFPGRYSQNIAKSNRVFPGKWRGDRAFISTYLNSPMAEVFPHYCLSFFNSITFRMETGGQDQKCKLWVHLFFMKTRILPIFFKQCSCLLEY